MYDQMDQDSEEQEGENEFEDDGFLVNDDDDASESSDTCQVCQKEDGTLMVCDGGRHMEGCGRCYHAGCVGRSSIPDGDWICTECAQSGGIAVQHDQGHEFVSKNKGGMRVIGPAFEDDESEDNDKVANVGALSSSSSRQSKRRRILEDTSDEDSN